MGAPTKRAFTLIELLVVIAIIAILAAILFPVFASARNRGQQAACASNLRQLWLANDLYAHDNDGFFVPAAPHFSNDGATRDDNHRWYGVRVNGVFQPKDGPLVPYMADGGLLRQCPSFNASIGFDKGTGGYVYNDVAVGSRVLKMGWVNGAYDASMNVSELKKPSQTAMFADGALDWGKALVEYTFLTPPPAISQRVFHYEMYPSIHFRHNGRADVAFVDGHVASFRMEDSIDSCPAYPKANPRAHNIGWCEVASSTFYDGQ